MKKFSQLLLAAAALSGALFISGCASTPAHYVDSTGPDTIVSLNKINIQDFYQAADDMVADILASGVLERAPQQPAIMAISSFKNATSNNFEMSLLTKKVSAALLKTGKVVTISNDPGAAAQNEKEIFMGRTGATRSDPYYTLSGKIIEERASDGSLKQTTYVFQLTLTTVKDRLGVWEGEKSITKQGKRASVGW
ncbi:membrane protein [Geminisphaera colitermitum]|uniref:membrane protein n=1 Tax=Geminisphaera colitermitum TaxID=1148786 RepID=UPI000196546A|nr:membrane protein [Geminisphaera colitermitum]